MDFATRTEEIAGFLDKGGPAIWAIAALSVATLALILWKGWRLAVAGAWSRRRAASAVELWLAGDVPGARRALEGARGLRARAVAAAIDARLDPELDAATAREEVARVATGELARARSGLRALELIATIAPLLGLLGTVLGMIAAFQTLQATGARADPAALAGGIWEALLTTAAGMAVAIPASVALTWFESVTDIVRLDIEDAATRILTRGGPSRAALGAAAE
ncbi:MotA/TolQ/ExbB proton channel family protein [Rhodovulum marinum]|uniref:Outer membrane transport energization protein ExbB n=1 Tax=Rhodovulum marinum TaxID=320662 RepID=A0A4R2QBB2_9RHOB|nr:MotA/TolQ/ExbB proton channel family protein [Rhodovulum marinum]TCP44145.1 outer membrane transport energization protein ExbB [Rhodovulum marinum]